MNSNSKITEQSISEVVEAILKDYDNERAIDKVNTFNQPDKEILVDIVHKLQQIIFPGYFHNKRYRTYTNRNIVTMLSEDVVYNLSKQISGVLAYDERYAEADFDVIKEKSDELAMEFMTKLPKIREYMETDVQAAYDGDPAATCIDEVILSYPGVYAIMINRIAHELFLLEIPLIPRMMTEHAHSVTGIDIHPGATIGKYFCIDHGTGIVVGETTVIGNNVKVYQGVTLGALSTKGGQKLRNKRRHPTIEDNVTIYSGASILGGETVIGEGVVVGGNAFITKSVQAGARVSVKNEALNCNRDAKNPVQKMELEQDETWYYVI